MVLPLLGFADFELDRGRFELRRGGRSLKLEKIPLELLILLVERDGQLVDRQEITERLWGRGVFLDTEHGINTAVRRVRQALHDDPDQPRFVQTVTGKGYRFIAAVEIHQSRDNGTGTGEIPRLIEPVPRKSAGVGAEGISFAPLPPPRLRISAPMGVLLSVVVALGLAWLFRPQLPAPTIARTVQLTSDGRGKIPPIATDGSRIYFTELVDDHWTVAAVSVAGGEVIPIRTPFQNAKLVAISSDKTELLVGDGLPFQEKALWLVPLLGGSPRRLGNMLARDASWSADGRKFAYVNGGDLYLAEADGTEVRKVSTNSEPNVWAWSPVWSPEGARLRFELYTMDKHTSALWEVNADGKGLHLLLPGWQVPPMHCCGAWTADGRYFVFDAWNDLEGGPPIAPAPNLWAIRETSDLFHKASPTPIQLTAGRFTSSVTLPAPVATRSLRSVLSGAEN